MFKFLNNKKNKDNLIIFISIVILALTIKTYFIFYFLLILFVLSTIATRDLFKFVKNNKIYMIYSSIFIIFFLTLNIFSTGCLIFPISISCFSELSWSMPITEVQHYSKWFEIWSKSLAGAGYVVDNSRNLTSDFKWVEIWYKNYSKKYFETIYLLVFISLCFLYFFKSHKIKLKSNKSFNYVISFVLFILIFWFIKHPTLRYGGYLIHVLIFSLILSKILERTTMTSLNIAKKSKLIVAICLCFFFFKNINRINDEFKRNDQYKFINFPYYFVKKTEFEKITYNNNVDIYFVDGACWATPPPCSANKDVIIKEFFGFKIINTKN